MERQVDIIKLYPQIVADLSEQVCVVAYDLIAVHVFKRLISGFCRNCELTVFLDLIQCERTCVLAASAGCKTSCRKH